MILTVKEVVNNIITGQTARKKGITSNNPLYYIIRHNNILLINTFQPFSRR